MLRAKAAVLLAQARTQSGDLQRALGKAQGDPALHARLAAAASQLTGVADTLSQALGSSAWCDRDERS